VGKSADRLLTPDEAVERLGVEKSWLYRNSSKLPFVIKLSRKKLRISEQKMERWLDEGGRR
jgi:predicted DNA-binding transcriptional regulator AlpA